MTYLDMTLFYLLTNNLELWPEAYECTAKLEKFGARWQTLGAYLTISGSVLLLLYIPCLIAIIKIKIHTAAYKLMLILAILDISSLTINSLVTGFLAYYGFSFCQYPLFFFVTGVVGTGVWMTGCLASILLGIERCSEVNSNFSLSFLFGKKVFRLVLFVLLSYAVYCLGFNKPAMFNPECSCFLFDPLIGKDPELYRNFTHAANNLVVAVLTTTLYFYLCYYLLFKFGYSTSMWLYKSKRQIILQGVILCFFHATAALIYAYMQYFNSPQWFTIIGHLVWQLSSGCLCIVYLTLNRTIRNCVLKMIIPKKIRKCLGLYIGVEEHIAMENAGETTGSGGGVAVVNAGAVQYNNFFPK